MVLQNPTAPEGKNFVGWFNLATGGEQITNISINMFDETDSITLFAVYQTITFNVSFVSGVEETIEPQTVEYGKKALQPQTLTKVGFNFEGWFAESSLESFDFNTPIKSNLVLTAKWTPISEVFYIVNGEAFVTVKKDNITAENLKNEYMVLKTNFNSGDVLEFYFNGVKTDIIYIDSGSWGVELFNGGIKTLASATLDLYIKNWNNGTWTIYSTDNKIHAENINTYNGYLVGSIQGTELEDNTEWASKGFKMNLTKNEYNQDEYTITLNLTKGDLLKFIIVEGSVADAKWYSIIKSGDVSEYCVNTGSDNNIEILQDAKFTFFVKRSVDEVYVNVVVEIENVNPDNTETESVDPDNTETENVNPDIIETENVDPKNLKTL